MKYRVNIRFGEEPDTMPEGWKFGRVSAVATDSAGHVYVFQRGPKADPHRGLRRQGQISALVGQGTVRQSARPAHR